MTSRQFSAFEKLFGVKCWFCGVRVRERDKVENHHKDGNRKNNRRENQTWVCLKCHDKVSMIQKNGRPKKISADEKPVLHTESGGVHVCEINGGRSVTDPKRTSSEERGDEIVVGLMRYLNEVALPGAETVGEILVNAPPWINRDNPPSEVAVRRRLKMFTESRYYNWRFDVRGRLYWCDDVVPVKKKVMAEPIPKEVSSEE